jgi:hypothetical protein
LYARRSDHYPSSLRHGAVVVALVNVGQAILPATAFSGGSTLQPLFAGPLLLRRLVGQAVPPVEPPSRLAILGPARVFAFSLRRLKSADKWSGSVAD